MKVYIGTKLCGCTTRIICDECEGLQETLDEYKRDGLKIEYVEIEQAREMLKECNHK